MSPKGTQRRQNAKTLTHIGGNLQTPPIGLWSLDFGAMIIACFAKDKFGAARDESPRFYLYPFLFTTIRDLAPLFSPNRHGTCEAADRPTLLLAIVRTRLLSKLVLGY